MHKKYLCVLLQSNISNKNLPLAIPMFSEVCHWPSLITIQEVISDGSENIELRKHLIQEYHRLNGYITKYANYSMASAHIPFLSLLIAFCISQPVLVPGGDLGPTLDLLCLGKVP
jgi:hypothetical protein